MRIGKSSGQSLVENKTVKRKNIASLKSDTGLSLTSTRGKLEVLQRHYQLLVR